MINNILYTHIEPSKIHGKGLFTDVTILKGSVVAILDGQVVDEEYFDDLLFSTEWNSISSDAILVRAAATDYRYINHSWQPNLTIRIHDFSIRALQDIETGCELTLNYAEHGIPESYLNSDRGSYLRNG